MTWQRGQSGNPTGRPTGIPSQKEYFEQLRVVSKELVEIIKTRRQKRRRKQDDGKRKTVEESELAHREMRRVAHRQGERREHRRTGGVADQGRRRGARLRARLDPAP